MQQPDPRPLPEERHEATERDERDEREQRREEIRRIAERHHETLERLAGR